MTAVFRSLNEIEQIARKAARVAGLPWGLADEVGGALRALQSYGFNAASGFARWLAAAAAHDLTAGAPRSLRGVWRARRGDLHPFLTGAALSDRRECWGAGVECACVAYPLLIAGCVLGIAAGEQRAFIVQWSGARIACRPGGVAVIGAAAAVECARADFFHLTGWDGLAEESAGQLPANMDAAVWRAPHCGETKIGARVWRRLEEYAAQTYVAASAASRLQGAGAGLRDND